MSEYREIVNCQFVVRTKVPEGFTYERVSLADPFGSGQLRTAFPPLVGDFLILTDQFQRAWPGTVRVVERSWMYSTFGSVNWPNWPYGSNEPKVPTSIEIFVELADGPYRDQVLTQDQLEDRSDV